MTKESALTLAQQLFDEVNKKTGLKVVDITIGPQPLEAWLHLNDGRKVMTSGLSAYQLKKELGIAL